MMFMHENGSPLAAIYAPGKRTTWRTVLDVADSEWYVADKCCNILKLILVRRV